MEGRAGYTNDGVHPNQNGTNAVVASIAVAASTWGFINGYGFGIPA